MHPGVVVLFFVVLGCSADGRRSPNADLVDEYFKTNGPSRYSDNLREDASLDVPGLIRKYGYPVEVHEVVTDDGYILELHRIPYGRDQANETNTERPAVLVMHGLSVSSAEWVMSGPGTALGYTLADAGFDVWLGNARGNFYSRRHVSLDPDNDYSFWEFSWDEIGRLDLPAKIDYILATTSKSRLHYIGHSQGTTIFWVMASMRPEYNEKIITMQAYAPVAYLQYNENPLFAVAAPLAAQIESLFLRLGIWHLFSRSTFISLFGRIFCSDGAPTQLFCTSVLFFIGGYSENQHNATMFPVYLGHAPAGMSVRQLVHYGQHIHQDHFRRYDYGMMNNWHIYRSFSPPAYELNKVTAPVYMHYVDYDTFADLRDVDRLWNEIGRPMAKLKVPYEPFSHIDFSWGQNAKAVLYDRTVDIMKVFPST